MARKTQLAVPRCRFVPFSHLQGVEAISAPTGSQTLTLVCPANRIRCDMKGRNGSGKRHNLK